MSEEREETSAPLQESDEDGAIFEINDFTNATAWEGFIADLERVFHQWGLAASDSSGEDSSRQQQQQRQHRKSERVSYAGWRFVVTLEVSPRGAWGASPSSAPSQSSGQSSSPRRNWSPAMIEMMDNSGDFPPKAHHISRWYGVSEFVLVAPDEGVQALTSQAQARLMLSSVAIAVSNTACTAPVFVQVQHKWRQMYTGLSCGRGLQTNFDSVHLRHTPAQFSCLSGLLELFRSKLRCPLVKMDPVLVAARLTYVLKQWSLDDWPLEPLGDVNRAIEPSSLQTLPVGAIADPIQELHLSSVWPSLTEELVVDTPTHTDLKPTHAPLWTVQVKVVDTSSCLLAEHLLSFLKACYCEDSLSQLLGHSSSRPLDDELPDLVSGGSRGAPLLSEALTRLTEPAAVRSSPFLSSVVHSAQHRLDLRGGGVVGGAGGGATSPLPDSDLETILKCLFPDAYDLPPSSPSPRKEERQGEGEGGSDGLAFRLKSAPLGCLTSLLANALCIVTDAFGVKALATVWFEVVQELRYRWENGLIITNIPPGSPDMSCCLIHQKLQMLNCCIRHKLSHQQKLNTPNIQSPNSHSKTVSSETKTTTSPHTSSKTPVNEITNSGSKDQAKPIPIPDEFTTPFSSLSEMARPGLEASNQGDDQSASSDGDKGETGNSDEEFYEALETQSSEGEEEEEEEGEGESVLRIETATSDDDITSPSPSHITSTLTGNHGPVGDETKPDQTKDDRTKHDQTKDDQTKDDQTKDDQTKDDRSKDDRSKDDHAASSESRGPEAVESDAAAQTKAGSGEEDECDNGQEDSAGRRERVGALERCGELVLVATGEPLYIPVTQDHTPMTEDMMLEQASVLANLGTSEEAAMVRAKMQSSSLISDMEAFKAANPGCLLEDFVRWYSPRDWEEEEEEVGKRTPSDQQLRRETASDQQPGEGHASLAGLDEMPEKSSKTVSEGDTAPEVFPSQTVECLEEGTVDSKRASEPVESERSKFAVEGEGGEEGWGVGWGEEEEEDWDVIADDTEGGSRPVEEEEEEPPSSTEPQKRFVRGRLSVRMRQPDNIWVETWHSTSPQPAYRQRRLFDDTKEAEKVLHYFAGMRPSALALSLMPVALHSGIIALRNRLKEWPLANVESILQDATALLGTIQSPSLDTLPKYQECIKLLYQAEHSLAAVNSLKTKLCQGLRAVSAEGLAEPKQGATTGGDRRGDIDVSAELLLEGPQLTIRDPTNSITGLALQGLLTMARTGEVDLDMPQLSPRQPAPDVFPAPSGKEFILRATVPRPAPFSHPSPQRMFCVLTGNEFRLAGATTSDLNLN